MRTCITCEKIKPLEDFRIKGLKRSDIVRRPPRSRECRSCRNSLRLRDVQQRKWERLLGKDDAQRALHAFKTTPACEACGVEADRMAIDHCHAKNVFRGILCMKCNVALGLVNDDPAVLRALIAYLRRKN